jgi:capsular polysaccharide biosynthesis protein
MDTFDGQALNLDEGPGVVQSAWRYKWLVAIAALVGALLGYAWEARQPTLYEGVSRLLLSSDGNQLPGDAQLPREDPQRFLSNQVELIGSWPVLEAAAKGVPGTSPALLAQQMTTEISKDADVITIRVLAPTAGDAAKLANSVGTAYDQFVKQSSQESAKAEVRELDAASRSLSTTLTKLEAAIQASPGDRSLLAKQRAVEAQLDATATRSQQLATQARLGTSRVVRQQDGAPPLQPAQPTPSRGAAAGLLLGLVGSSAFAWWLNSRRMAQPGRAAGNREPADVDRGRSAERQPAPNGRMAGAWTDTGPVAGNGHGAQRGHVDDTLDGWLTAQRPAGLDDAAGNRETFQRQPPAQPVPSDANGSQGAVKGSVEAGGNDLRALFARVAATLGDEPVDWYLDNLPQRMAEQLTVRVHADVVTVLLDKADGLFEVAGSIGLTAEEQGVAVDVDNDILREALRHGASVFQDANPMPAAVSVPGSRTAEALVVVPLVEGSSWLGALLVGRQHSDNGHRVALFSDQEIERIILFAMEIAPTLQALLLLGRLRRPLRSIDDASPDPGERTRRSAGSD